MTSNETVRLQMMMAFGQGAGSMRASLDAIQWLMTDPSTSGDIDRAAANWDASKWAFLDLIRVLGQIAATKAAVAGDWQIERTHLEQAIPAVRIGCPC
jgi:hypothetical protein